LLDGQLGEKRERYHQLIAPGGPGRHPADRRAKARPQWHAVPQANCARRWACVRSFTRCRPTQEKSRKAARFVSFREDDGSFRFRLLAADGEQLLLSRNFADGKSAGR
jgi:tryptophanyl-tRNA synthetase